MEKQYRDQQESTFQGVIIDYNTKEPVDKECILALLRVHHIDTEAVETPEIRIEDVIPTLRKAKINLPEAFYKDLAQKLSLPFWIIL